MADGKLKSGTIDMTPTWFSFVRPLLHILERPHNCSDVKDPHRSRQQLTKDKADLAESKKEAANCFAYGMALADLLSANMSKLPEDVREQVKSLHEKYKNHTLI